MTILLQGSNCRPTVQSGFMHLFIVEPFLQTIKAPRGPIILVFSSAYYATLPQFINVAQAWDATDFVCERPVVCCVNIDSVSCWTDCSSASSQFELSRGSLSRTTRENKQIWQANKVILSRKPDVRVRRSNEISSANTKGVSQRSSNR